MPAPGKPLSLSLSSSCVLIVAVLEVRVTIVSANEEIGEPIVHFYPTMLTRRTRSPLDNSCTIG